MTLLAALVCVQLHAQKVDKSSLGLYQRHFVVRRGDEVERVPLSVPSPEPKLSVLFRRGPAYVCWDDRGMTIRADARTVSTRMPEVAVSPKLQPRSEIRKDLALFKEGKRSKTANALSGAMRVGSRAYLLLRWDDASGKPWLEALVSVDLAADKPKPELLGKFEGFTLATKAIDDRLFIVDGKLAAILRQGDAWGVGTYDVKAKAFGFLSLGEHLTEYIPQGEERGLFVEQSGYGTTVAGRVDLHDGHRKTLAESHGPMKFIDNQDPPLAIIVGPHGHVVRNLNVGSEVSIFAGNAVRRGKLGLVMWSPVMQPTVANLYDVRDWSRLATWAANASGGSAGH